MDNAGPASEPTRDRLVHQHVEELPRAGLDRLLMKAVTRRPAPQVTSDRREHIPVYAYHLLRRVAQNPVPVVTLFGREDDAALAFLLSRGLVTVGAGDDRVGITAAGEELGAISDERLWP